MNHMINSETKREKGNVFFKMFDKYLGIPLVFLLGLFQRKKHLPLIKMSEIALLKTASIGDTVLLSAIIADLKRSNPNLHISLFVSSNNYSTATLLSGVERVIKLPINSPLNAIKIVREERSFDVWLDFGPWPRINALLSYFAKAGIKIGFKTPGQFRHYVYDYIVQHSAEIHELQNYRHLLGVLGIVGTNRPYLDIQPAESFRDTIIIHMFPGGYKSYLKEWQEEKWVDLINILNRNEQYRIILTGASSDRLRALIVKGRVEKPDFVEVVAGQSDLLKIAQIIKAARLVISVNTGIMHLASALNTNLVALHGPTSVNRWGPLNLNSESVVSELKCSPCINLGFEYHCNMNNCMKNISVAKVVDATRRFL